MSPKAISGCPRCGGTKYDDGSEHHLTWCHEIAQLKERVEKLEADAAARKLTGVVKS